MARLFSPLFNPIKSTQTKLVETRGDGLKIYSHTSKRIAGKFLVVRGENDWSTCETLAEARADIWGGL